MIRSVTTHTCTSCAVDIGAATGADTAAAGGRESCCIEIANAAWSSASSSSKSILPSLIGAAAGGAPEVSAFAAPVEPTLAVRAAAAYNK